MSASTKATRDGLVRQFVSITRATQADSTRLLKKHNWKLDVAVDNFYTDAQAMRNANIDTDQVGTGSTAKSNESTIKKNLDKLWGKYADPTSPNVSNLDGTILYCSDLGIDPEDPITLALAQVCAAPTMGLFDKKGWVEYWKGVKRDTVATQKEHVPSLRKLFLQESSYKKIYQFTFEYAKVDGQKSLQCETAIALWRLLIPLIPAKTSFPPSHLDLWCEFLEERGNKAVSKDTWMLFVEFVNSIDSTFGNHDLEAAWPSVIDDFVEWVKPKVDADEAMDVS